VEVIYQPFGGWSYGKLFPDGAGDDSITIQQDPAIFREPVESADGPGPSTTFWLAARLSPCCSSRSTLNNSARIGVPFPMWHGRLAGVSSRVCTSGSCRNCENHFTGLSRIGGVCRKHWQRICYGRAKTNHRPRSENTDTVRPGCSEIRGSQLEKKLHSSLHQPRRLCIYHLAKRRTANVPSTELRAKKLCVIESVEGLKPELQGF